MLRNEDQKSAVRSLREYLDTVKQKRLPKDSATTETAAGKEKDASATRSNPTPVPVTGSSLAPSLSTISESSQAEEDSQGQPAVPKLQRLTSEENQSASSVVTGISTATSISTASSITAGGGGVEVGGEIGGAEEGGVATAIKVAGQGQDAVGGVFPNNSGMVPPPSTPHSATLSNHQFEPSNLLVAKRSDTAPPSTPANHINNRAPSAEPLASSSQNTLGATSQSNIHATPDHQGVALPPGTEEERKTTSRTNSNESEKGSQNQSTAGSSPDKKVSVGSEGTPQVQKEATSSVQPSNSLTVQGSSSRSLALPVGPVEGSGVGMAVNVSGGGAGGGGGMSRTSSEDSSTATPTNPPPNSTSSMLQPQELAVVQSEHSTESTPTHNSSQGSLESTSASAISSQEQLSSQDARSDKEREKGTNGTLKKKAQRSKSKQIKLNLVQMTDEKVVKCTLVTGAGQMVNFQFSKNYDKPLAIFQKLVSSFHQYMQTIRTRNSPNVPILLFHCTYDLFLRPPLQYKYPSFACICPTLSSMSISLSRP